MIVTRWKGRRGGEGGREGAEEKMRSRQRGVARKVKGLLLLFVFSHQQVDHRDIRLAGSEAKAFSI